VLKINTKLLLNVLKVIKDGNNSELNNIPAEARDNIFDFAIKEGLIDGLTKTKDGYVGEPKITLKGLEYFNENKTSTVIYKSLKEIRDWIPGY